jgi:hypothetical protein
LTLLLTGAALGNGGGRAHQCSRCG